MRRTLSKISQGERLHLRRRHLISSLLPERDFTTLIYHF